MTKKEDLRSLYAELQGYLTQAPTPKELYDTIYSDRIWKQYNECVKLITNILGQDYNRFIIKPHEGGTEPYVNLYEYLQALGGIIAKLHGEHFSGEPFPLGSQPSTIITQNQQQNQSFNIQMLLDIIDEKTPKYQEGSKEKTFLQKIRNSLSSISNITQFLIQLCKTAKEFGLNIDDISKIFS